MFLWLVWGLSLYMMFLKDYLQYEPSEQQKNRERQRSRKAGKQRSREKQKAKKLEKQKNAGNRKQ